ncbi:MAG: UDP binding domain-containing protein, partial [Gammaproteobacteria bacterium]
AGIHEAPSIKVAEAAKVTENIQRDVNIALINEMHQLYTSIGINTNDVIEAASSKWNFMKLTPGMVGGHCISIDPYYLMHKSLMSGFTPNLMITARKINDEMDQWVLNDFIKFAKLKKIDINKIKVTVLGYTFKENCSDTRNTKVKSLIILMKNKNINFELWDPLILKEDYLELNKLGIKALKSEPKNPKIVMICVNHQQFDFFLENYNGIIYDYRYVHSS